MAPFRYLIRGLIDGALSTLGIVLGASIGGNAKVIMAAGLSGGMANAVSNLLGAFMAERASILAGFRRYERAMVGSDIKLKDTKIYKAKKREIWIGGVYDCLSTFLGSVVPVLPFAFVDVRTGITAAVVTTLVLLFALGVGIGRISRENMLISGSKMAIFGILTALLALSIEFFFR